MQFIITVLQSFFTAAFFRAAVTQGMPLLFGATGEILTEKSGHLNLGLPGIMYMGGIGGLIGAFLYENAVATPNAFVAVSISFLCAFIAAVLGGLVYCVLTVTLRANQNVSGLALTTFGVGLGNFLGGSIMKLTGKTGQITVYFTGKAFKECLPFAESEVVLNNPFLNALCTMFCSYGFLTYLAIAIAIVAGWVLAKTRVGLNLRAIGESPATADAASIPVDKYKYITTCIGAGIAGLGGLYFVMEYMGGTWQNDAFGDRGWLAIALVIFARWKPGHAIWGSILFGGLYMLYTRLPIANATQEFFKMLPYIVTIIVLIITSFRKKREDQPPASLGIAYFREER
ncbi:MAG: ABC transporter permease [Eubacteriales bacterium]|nr:ABC transporter permease [Eubacteriales bacterium]